MVCSASACSCSPIRPLEGLIDHLVLLHPGLADEAAETTVAA